MNITTLYSNRSQIDTYDLDRIPPNIDLVESMLKTTHDLVPSKQRFMPYKIHVLGPDKTIEKEELYRLTQHRPGGGEGRPSYHNKGSLAPYVLIFTMRKCIPNESIIVRQKRGHVYPQCNSNEYRNDVATISTEIGMFATILTGLCMENNLDVSYIKCYPSWTEEDNNPWKNLNFVSDPVLLVMGIGYKHPDNNRKYADTEFKPDYDEVINWIK